MKQTRLTGGPASLPPGQHGLAAGELGEALQHAMALAKGGKPDPARTILLRVLGLSPENPDALQLLGMIARQAGRNDEAADFFRRSLAAAPAQPHVQNNLGNSLVDLGAIAEAALAYREALRLAPGYDEARVNLAVAELAGGDAAGACQTLAPLLRRDPRHARAWAILGQARRANGELDHAIAAFRTSLSLRPDHVPTLHNLGVALRLAGWPDEALPLLARASEAAPASPEIAYNLGHCLQDLGRIDAAIIAYERAITLRPTDRAAHQSLNGLLWRQGRKDAWLASYRAALARHPDDQGLLCDLADRLLLAGDAAGAAALLAPHAGDAGPELRFQLGRARWSLGESDAALAAFDAAPGFAPAQREAARARIILDRPAEALTGLAPLLAANPADQQALALQGLAWRFTGDPREAWLNDTDRLVSASLLTPADGDVTGFNTRLDAALSPLHRDHTHPLEQTLRGGTQTSDDLFALPDPMIARVRAMIEAQVAAWLAGLPRDTEHPFLRRNTGRFAFSGSWSVRLRSSGFHENHIHPEGWISACYYVALPQAVDFHRQGWLKFGETGLRLGERERITRMIRPEPGLLVLFPSYFYHGTVPFEDAGHRTTIAFDIVPA
ncbi:tetratricopeptide repeat protein [Sphingomonas sp. HITSZ_GF]|uniref:tetratricopeptide repeat protein n=1 Tax=Sphingomonas sp. HITSZ_GF TaxID=3037247 RepID=UPI00240E611E|nr:tetratricopeptide repeat protein [Sphingomonas sp. HITSZ_GF]MDG2534200.1 tetratricopeptide repeat protein [Sphingomonas sp. HITSZ_GF]